MKSSPLQRKWLCLALLLAGIETPVWLVCGAWDALHPRYQAIARFTAQFLPANGFNLEMAAEVRKAAAASGAIEWSLKRPVFENKPKDLKDVYPHVEWWVRGFWKPPFRREYYEFSAITENPSSAVTIANQVIKNAIDSINAQLLRSWAARHDSYLSAAKAARQSGQEKAAEAFNGAAYAEETARVSSPFTGWREAQIADVKMVRSFENGWVQALTLGSVGVLSMLLRPGRLPRQPATLQPSAS